MSVKYGHEPSCPAYVPAGLHAGARSVGLCRCREIQKRRALDLEELIADLRSECSDRPADQVDRLAAAVRRTAEERGTP